MRKYDKLIALVFVGLTALFLVVAFTNKAFFDWIWARHHNQLSWYIRPLFLLPFCYAAYKRSWSGIFATIFLLLTSMFWFPKPAVVHRQVEEFLAMEMDYLTGDWQLAKVLISMLVPISLGALAFACWKRSLWFGISVLVFIAVAKMLWSVIYGGEAGTSIFVPAILGLGICVALVYRGFRRLEKS